MTTPPADTPEPDIFSPEWTEEAVAEASGWLARAQAEFLTLDMAIQAGAVAAAVIAGLLLRGPVKALLARLFTAPGLKRAGQGARELAASLAGPAIIFALLFIGRIALVRLGYDGFVVNLFASLFGAWVLIRLLTSFIRDPFWSRTVATFIWLIAALNILGLLGPLSDLLGAVSFDPDGRVSLLSIIRAILILAVLFWAASLVARTLSARIEKAPTLTPSARLLISKTIQITLIAVAVVAALSMAGINLAALAIFSGAIGLGIGFGLQKIFANLISGIILLLDRSIKPGDVITLEETYGHVNTLGMRFASVITRDGHEHLIPNEDFITTKVINWSFSDEAVRIKRPVGVAYGTDVPKAMELVVEAANTVPRVLKTPATRCLLRGFGDNSIDLEVRFWIADPSQGVNNVSSEVLLAIWKSFEANGVAFPFPQRDVHLDATSPIPVRVERGPPDAD